MTFQRISCNFSGSASIPMIFLYSAALFFNNQTNPYIDLRSFILLPYFSPMAESSAPIKNFALSGILSICRTT